MFFSCKNVVCSSDLFLAIADQSARHGHRSNYSSGENKILELPHQAASQHVAIGIGSNGKSFVLQSRQCAGKDSR